jgi:hypothetical protein
MPDVHLDEHGSAYDEDDQSYQDKPRWDIDQNPMTQQAALSCLAHPDRRAAKLLSEHGIAVASINKTIHAVC